MSDSPRLFDVFMDSGEIKCFATDTLRMGRGRTIGEALDDLIDEESDYLKFLLGRDDLGIAATRVRDILSTQARTNWLLVDITEGGAKVLGGGHWVPWCVAHRGGGVTASYCAASDEHFTRCRWHPQGAFIPDDEGGTT